MYYRATGFPEEGELVFCTVTNVQYNSVFVNIEEYNRSGLIHISEISTGRIRNIRDYVKEGKKVVCKVIQIDEEKGHIDLSLRRVTEIQRKNKVNERKQEQKAENIIQDLGRELEEHPKKIYQRIRLNLEAGEFLHKAFEAVVEEDRSLKEFGFPEPYAEPLEKLVREKISRKVVKVGGEIKIQTYDNKGLELVKNSLQAAESVAEKIKIRYLGAGSYRIEVEDYNYKDAENHLSEALKSIKEPITASEGGTFEFHKKDLS